MRKTTNTKNNQYKKQLYNTSDRIEVNKIISTKIKAIKSDKQEPM